MDDNVRVAILTTSFPLSRDSISGIFISRLVRHLPRTIRPTVLTPCGQQIPVDDDGANYKLNCFRYAPLRWQVLAHQPGGIPVAIKRRPILALLIPVLLLSSLVACIRACRHVDIIHANWSINGVIAAVVGRFLGVPVVTTLRGEDITRAKRLWVDGYVLRLCVSLSSRIVTVSTSIGDLIKLRYAQHAHKVRVIPNGVDEHFLDQPLGLSQDRHGLRLISIGSLIPRKGLDQALLALAHLNDNSNITLDILGQGPEEKRLRELVTAHTLHDRVRFLGQVQADDVLPYLFAADALILCSHSEGRPNVVLEAMAAGLPVVATDIEGVRELVQPGVTGLLFEPGDHEALARQVLALRDPELRCRMGRAARQFIIGSRLLWKDTAAHYAELYKEVRAQCVLGLST